MKYVIASILMAGSLLVGTAGAAAATPQISIPINTIKRGAEGSVHVLAKEKVNIDYVGLECSVSAVAENQGSVHPNNDPIVSSGDDSVVLADVEREANGLTTADGMLTAGEDLTVSLKLGKDKVFSGGMTVELHCEKPEPKTIEVCRDGEVITINEDEKLATDTTVPCPVVEIEVCRDGTVVTINEDERLDTDTEAPCPEVPEVKGEVVELPQTGAGSVVALLGSTFVGGTVLSQLRLRRK